MTSAQTKQLLAVSRKALALLDPSWPIHAELKAALNQPVEDSPRQFSTRKAAQQYFEAAFGPGIRVE